MGSVVSVEDIAVKGQGKVRTPRGLIFCGNLFLRARLDSFPKDLPQLSILAVKIFLTSCHSVILLFP